MEAQEYNSYYLDIIMNHAVDNKVIISALAETYDVPEKEIDLFVGSITSREPRGRLVTAYVETREAKQFPVLLWVFVDTTIRKTRTKESDRSTLSDCQVFAKAVGAECIISDTLYERTDPYMCSLIKPDGTIVPMSSEDDEATGEEHFVRDSRHPEHTTLL